ncbi:hypothetical protein [Phytoactinopolyspora halotolerans]|uniref:Uncharacterized protein n=1 Tax=Phytoactinopolyspora halotolerans TaxID=1981512 RepID=A0A6L9SCL6_9ACTN|nr:hypothetical protein [Phytoactinopolyspora halotolerans]NEE02332.1 hypothetical protein [Phytoactinopolyspora halotolerans]
MSWEHENNGADWGSRPGRSVSTAARVRLVVLIVVGVVAGEALGLAFADSDDGRGWLRPILIGGCVGLAVLLEFGVLRRLGRRR